MTEACLGMFRDISIQLLPVIPVIADFLTVEADRQEALKRFDVCKRFLQFFDALGERLLQLHNTFPDLDSGAQFVEVKGLRHVVVGAGVQAGDHVVPRVAGGQQNEIGRLLGLETAEFLTDFGTCEAGHHPVENREWNGRLLLQSRPGLSAVLRQHDFVPVLLQPGFQQPPGNPVVFCNEYFHVADQEVASSTKDLTVSPDEWAGQKVIYFNLATAGRRKATVVPVPSPLWIFNSPPCNSVSRLAIVRPRPEPCCSYIFRSNC